MQSKQLGRESKKDKRLMLIILWQKVLININKIKLTFQTDLEPVLTSTKPDLVYIFRKFTQLECVENKSLMRLSTEKELECPQRWNMLVENSRFIRKEHKAHAVKG